MVLEYGEKQELVNHVKPPLLQKYYMCDKGRFIRACHNLQVDGPEVHDIEPRNIPEVELEETEVGHKDNFETVDLLFYARTISGVRNVTVKYPLFDWLE